MANVIAVVVGLCAHGLAISRALNRAGVRVVALEANRSLPGVKSSSAEVRFVDDINGNGLPEALLRLAPEISASGRPVLFLTNDTMIATIGFWYDTVAGHYRISWGAGRARLLSLLRKREIEARCVQTNLAYPKSILLAELSDLAAIASELNFPVIVKPDKPISAYKTLLLDEESQVDRSSSVVASSLPAIAQEFVPGDESRTYFAALYLDQGRVLARFEGRKLRARPMGHTTVAISSSNDEAHLYAVRFFDGLELSGPVSLELKQDPDGRFWVIEPTVGRTDFWVGLCIEDGVNLPLIEYTCTTDSCQARARQKEATMWINGERDSTALLWILLRYPRYLLQLRIVGVFIDLKDLKPFLFRLTDVVRSVPAKAKRKLLKAMKVDFSTQA